MWLAWLGAIAIGLSLGLLGSAVVPLKNDDRPAAIPAVTLAAAWDLSDRLSLSSNLGWVYGGLRMPYILLESVNVASRG